MVDITNIYNKVPNGVCSYSEEYDIYAIKDSDSYFISGRTPKLTTDFITFYDVDIEVNELIPLYKDNRIIKYDIQFRYSNVDNPPDYLPRFMKNPLLANHQLSILEIDGKFRVIYCRGVGDEPNKIYSDKV